MYCVAASGKPTVNCRAYVTGSEDGYYECFSFSMISREISEK